MRYALDTLRGYVTPDMHFALPLVIIWSVFAAVSSKYPLLAGSAVFALTTAVLSDHLSERARSFDDIVARHTRPDTEEDRREYRARVARFALKMAVLASMGLLVVLGADR